jgi:hypothetical protein
MEGVRSTVAESEGAHNATTKALELQPEPLADFCAEHSLWFHI